MDPKLINFLTFAAASLAVVGIFSIISDLVLREKARVRDRIRDQFGLGDSQSRKSDLLKDLKLLRSETSRRKRRKLGCNRTSLWCRETSDPNRRR